jgi:hypothetical protein
MYLRPSKLFAEQTMADQEKPNEIAPPYDPERVAVLVIHGIGQQRPYETLDQFTRNLLTSLSTNASAWTVQAQLDSQPDPTRVDKAWVRASFVLSPPAGTTPAFTSDPTKSIQDISLFEYYWAPITQEKISYIGSLSFLIRAGSRPFLYLASNINVLWATAKKRIPIVIAKELWRQACLFIPLLLFLIGLLYWLQTLSITSLKELRHIHALLVVSAIVLGIRYLYIYTCAVSLAQSLKSKSGWQCSPWWRGALLIGLAGHLILWPLYFSPIAAYVARGLSYVADKFPAVHHLSSWSAFLVELAAKTQFPYGAHFSQQFLAFLLINRELKIYTGEAVLLLLAFSVRAILINYIGDIATYVNSSQFSSTYPARTQIIDECSATLAGILTQRYASGPQRGALIYDRVLIAAHSLGTVIAYDTMNTLLNLARTSDPSKLETFQPSDLNNLRGLVTFGSPLNKIFYFFREQGDPKLVLRRQILDILHGFRLDPRVSDTPAEPALTPNPDPRWSQANQALSSGFKWINAYSLEDPISGRIAFYIVDQQKRFEYLMPFLAHMSYWEDQRFYTFVRNYLL